MHTGQEFRAKAAGTASAAVEGEQQLALMNVRCFSFPDVAETIQPHDGHRRGVDFLWKKKVRDHDAHVDVVLLPRIVANCSAVLHHKQPK